MTEGKPPMFPGPATAIHRGGGRRVGVAQASGQYGVFAVEPIHAGEFLLRIEGERTALPSRHSVQVDQNVHICPGGHRGLDELLARYAWRFLNHSCEPNTMIRGQDVVAVRPILPRGEVLFNYNSTEYDMAEPFLCHCSSRQCLGRISGFRHLSAPERGRLRPWLAPHLLRAWEAELALAAAPALLGTNVAP